MGMLIPEVTQTVEQSAKTYPEIGIRIPQIYLPRRDIDISALGGGGMRPIHLAARILGSS